MVVLRSSSSAQAGRLVPIAACVAALFGLTAQTAVAGATHLVTSCNDAGPGSLRAVIGDAGTLSGDTVDFSKLSCSNSVISLTTGAIAVPQTDLTITGTKDVLIVGKYNNDRLFAHSGLGTLNFLDVAMGPATATGYAAVGGCVFSSGTVALYNSVLSGCSARAPVYGYAAGGAVAAAGGVRLKYSQIIDSTAESQYGLAYGGAVFTNGKFTARYSTLSGNKATGYGGTGTAGAVFVSGDVSLNHVTVSSNTAGFTAGAILQAGGASFTMSSSTISGNESRNGYIGGIAIKAVPSVAIANSTIAFNTAAVGFYGVGLALTAGSGGNEVNVQAKIQSTLISNNSTGTGDLDFSQTPYGSKTITFDPATQGNLIRIPAGPVPLGTITLSCPNLGPLRDNGGLTRTHSLGSKSIAIDNGANPNSESQDQRGLGSDSSLFPRVSNGKADIGAYEINQDDAIFNSSLEGC